MSNNSDKYTEHVLPIASIDDTSMGEQTIGIAV
jgi:hypothetical protein